MKCRLLTLAHSPDADDAFMFYALTHGKVDTQGLTFCHELCDIETLNRRALEGVYDITAISFHAYPRIQTLYRLLTSGASVGDGYGPVVISRHPLPPSELRGKKIAVPGTLTTAFLALKLFQPQFEFEVVPFDRIPEMVLAGHVAAGVVIHEGQLNFGDFGLHKVIDLGAWWTKLTQLPLPLGGNAIKKSLSPEVARTANAVLRESIRYALEHREEALDYALPFARGLDRPRALRFIGMYVNEYTLDLGDKGKKALNLLLQKGTAAGLIAEKVAPEFVV